MTNLATKEQLLKSFDRKHEDVTIDGLAFRVREMRESERTEFDFWMRDSKGKVSNKKLAESRIKLITLCLCDEGLHLLFDEKDFDAIREWPARITSKLAEVCMRLSGLSDDDLDDEVKN